MIMINAFAFYLAVFKIVFFICFSLFFYFLFLIIVRRLSLPFLNIREFFIAITALLATARIFQANEDELPELSKAFTGPVACINDLKFLLCFQIIINITIKANVAIYIYLAILVSSR